MEILGIYKIRISGEEREECSERQASGHPNFDDRHPWLTSNGTYLHCVDPSCEMALLQGRVTGIEKYPSHCLQ